MGKQFPAAIPANRRNGYAARQLPIGCYFARPQPAHHLVDQRRPRRHRTRPIAVRLERAPHLQHPALILRTRRRSARDRSSQPALLSHQLLPGVIEQGIRITPTWPSS